MQKKERKQERISIITSVFLLADQGIFPEDTLNREFTFPATQYNISTLTPNLCRYQCYKEDFRFVPP